MKDFIKTVCGIAMLVPYTLALIVVIAFPFMGIFCPNLLKINFDTVMSILVGYSYIFYSVFSEFKGFDVTIVTKFSLQEKILITVLVCMFVLSILIMCANA